MASASHTLFGEAEGNVGPTSEPPNGLIPTVRRLPHRDEKVGVGDVEGPRAVSAVAVVDVSPLYPHLVVLIDDGPEGLQNDPGGERNVTIAREPTEIY